MGQRASVGTTIEGKYRLEEELGAGGMGSVWLATQLMVERPVAVKLLHPAFIDQDDLQARFEVEAKAIGRLNHPNVITLYDFGFSEDLQAFYTVIEYIDGVSLDKRLNDRLGLEEIVAIIRQVALALDHAHHFNILHRDLKPENVMLASMTDGSEIVKVLDFGIARIVKGGNQPETQESQRITKAGEVFGTPAYMSPEQARSIRQLEPSADLYSLGVMFYELIAGSLPFFAHSAFDLLMLHVTKPVPPLRRPDVPDELQEIVYRLLEKDPEKRFQSGKELVEALDALDLPDEEVSVDDLESGPTVVQQTPTPTIGHAPPSPGSTLDEQTNPDAPPGYSVPTAADSSADDAQTSRPTMMLDGGDDVIVETGDFTSNSRRNRVIGAAVVIVMLGLVIGGLLFWATSSDDTGVQPTEAASMENEPTMVIEPDDTTQPPLGTEEIAEAARAQPAKTPIDDAPDTDEGSTAPSEAEIQAEPAAKKPAKPEPKVRKRRPKPPREKPRRNTEKNTTPKKIERVKMDDEPKFERFSVD